MPRTEQLQEMIAEHLSLVLGPNAFVSREWLEQELERYSVEESQAASATTPQATATAAISSAKPTHAQSVNPAGQTLEALAQELTDCARCKLCEAGRKTIVFGEGNPKAQIMFVGEGPGETEDQMGRPFVGKAGQLLDKIIEAMGLKREDVYIANVVKCRPPANRNPEDDEVAACLPFVTRQIEIVNPKMLIALGGVALKALTSPNAKITKERGEFTTYHGKKEIPLMPTFHPAYLLRNPPAKRDVWEDMKKVLAKLNEHQA